MTLDISTKIINKSLKLKDPNKNITSKYNSAGPVASEVKPPLSIDQHFDSATTAPPCLNPVPVLNTAATASFPSLTCIQAACKVTVKIENTRGENIRVKFMNQRKSRGSLAANKASERYYQLGDSWHERLQICCLQVLFVQSLHLQMLPILLTPSSTLGSI